MTKPVLLTVAVASVIAIAIAVFLWQNRLSSDTSQDARAVVTAPSPTSTAAPQGATTAAQADSSTMLSSAGVKRVLSFVANGNAIKDTPEYQRFLSEAALDHRAALIEITRVFDATPAHEVMERVYIFGVVMEISEAIKRTDPAKADAFLSESRGLIDRQLAEPSRVPMPRQNYTQQEIDAFVHGGLYLYEDQMLYANTYRPKFMAVAVLREAGTPYAVSALAEIAGSNDIDSNVRQIAAMGGKSVRRE